MRKRHKINYANWLSQKSCLRYSYIILIEEHVPLGVQEEGASSLAPDLLAQIDETLEEITPRCVLELLALPLDDEWRTRREEGLHGVRNILWAVGGGGATAIAGGFTREDFMNEAFEQMTASEQVLAELKSF